MSVERPISVDLTPKEGEEKSLVVRLTTNPTLNQLVDTIANKPIDWEVFEAYLRGKGLKADQIKAVGGAQGALWELYIDMMIALFAERRYDIRINPIPDGTKTTSFEFYHSDMSKGGRFSVRQGHSGQTHTIADYDELLEIEGLPVVFEVKSSVRKSKKYRAATRKNPILRRSYIVRFSTPLAEYYKKDKEIDIGYAVFLMPEAISKTSSTQQDFIDRGGILRHLPTTSEVFVAQSNLLLQFL